MKKKLKELLYRTLCAALIAITMLSAGACGKAQGHIHDYGEEIAAVVADCYNAGIIAHYDCSCGKHFVKENGIFIEKTEQELKTSTVHDIGDRIERVAPTCEAEGVAAHYECIKCGKSFVKRGSNYVEQSEKELVLPMTGHDYSCEVTSDEYLVSDATDNSRAIYKYSCKCGLASEESVFEYGETLYFYKNALKEDYMPVSVTLTMYDAGENIYGITYNTAREAGKARILYQKGKKIDKNAISQHLSCEKYDSFVMDGREQNISYYVYKAEIKAEPNCEYVYKIVDEYAETCTEEVVFKTLDAKKNSFKFAHVSDSQESGTNDGSAGDAVGTGKDFGKVLSAITASGNDFIVHTGDFVEYGKYENYWKAMLDDNFGYLSKIPVQAISGNHETTYRSGTYETFKHFNYKLTEQDAQKGIYYSFVYGNAKFIMVNTNRLGANKLTAEQYDWLERELKEDFEWKIVALHHPLFSAGKWGANPDKNEISLGLRAQLHGLFAENGVDLVLQGHDHCVSRTFPIDENGAALKEDIAETNGTEYSVNPSGVIYVMNGPAGNQSGDYVYKNDENLYVYAELSHSRSWAEIEINDLRLTVTVNHYSESGVEIQKRWGIEKTL